jgi:hypothetical protein
MQWPSSRRLPLAFAIAFAAFAATGVLANAAAASTVRLPAITHAGGEEKDV